VREWNALSGEMDGIAEPRLAEGHAGESGSLITFSSLDCRQFRDRGSLTTIARESLKETYESPQRLFPSITGELGTSEPAVRPPKVQVPELSQSDRSDAIDSKFPEVF
jgi:hypothetical protein